MTIQGVGTCEYLAETFCGFEKLFTFVFFLFQVFS